MSRVNTSFSRCRIDHLTSLKPRASSWFASSSAVKSTTPAGRKSFLLDKTMLNTSPGSRWEAMWARISLGMSQSVGGEVRIFLAGGSMATREVAVSSLLPRCVSFQLPIRGIDSAFWDETRERSQTNRWFLIALRAGPRPYRWEIAAPPAAPLEPPRGISTRPARSRRPPSWRCAHSPTFYPMSPPANFSSAGQISDGTLPSFPPPYLRRTWDARAAR